MKQVYFLGLDFKKENSLGSKVFRKFRGNRGFLRLPSFKIVDFVVSLRERLIDFYFFHIKDSFELVGVLNTKADFILIDSFEDLPTVKVFPLNLFGWSPILSSEDVDSNVILSFLSPEKIPDLSASQSWAKLKLLLEI